VEIEAVVGDRDHVAVGPRGDRVGSQDLAQLVDVALDRVRGRLGRVAAPQLVDQPVARNDLVRAGEEDGQQRALAGAAKGERAAVDTGLERTEDAVLNDR
jgi:hypothetical protein